MDNIFKGDWERARDIIAMLCEYLALARTLKDSSPAEDYRRANQLSFQLAIVLPETLYREMAIALAAPNADVNPGTVVISARKLFYRDVSGLLSQNDLLTHAPGIGQKEK